MGTLTCQSRRELMHSTFVPISGILGGVGARLTEGRLQCSSQEVIAFSSDLGNTSATSNPVIALFGYVRDPSIEYGTANGVKILRPYYTSQYSNVPDMVRYTVVIT